MVTFKVGDIAKRVRHIGGYAIGTDEFEVVSVDTRYGDTWVVDPHGQEHNAENLERVKRKPKTASDVTIVDPEFREWSLASAEAAGNAALEADMVNHPPHYTSDPSGVECIQITRHRNFNIGNAIKYLWRSGLKDAGVQAKEIEDLRKAVFYIEDEIKRIEGIPAP